MPEPVSALDRLRRRYRAMASSGPQTFDMAIGRTAAGDLVAVYKEVEWDDFEEIVERWRDNGDGARRDKLYAYAELLAKGVVDILIRDDDHEDAVERKGLPGRYVPGVGLGSPVTFHGAAVALELPVDEDPLVAVFSVLGSDYEVDRHGQALSSWEPRVSPEVDEAFVGESEAAPPAGASPAGP